MKIVLGGSRHLEFIPDEVAQSLARWMADGDEFQVGDAPGIDKAFQVFLLDAKYERVRVYSSATETRNNLGDWPVIRVESGLKSKSSAVHAFKDRAMGRVADLGLMVWDCKSAGTLSNVIDLIRQRKSCLIWVAPDSKLLQFETSESLDKWMLSYPLVRDESMKRLASFEKRENKRAADALQPELFLD